MNAVELLIVEETEERRAKMCDVARRVGFESIIEAANILQVEELVRDNDFEMAVVTLSLSSSWGGKRSEEVGLELVSSLAKAQPDCRIIAVTGDPFSDHGTQAMERGASDFLNASWIRLDFFALLEDRLRIWREAIRKYRSAHRAAEKRAHRPTAEAVPSPMESS